MPVSVRIGPFSKKLICANLPLRIPQARVLTALMPTDLSSPIFDWPILTRATMRSVCGMSPTNSMNRILHGIKDGPGKHLGLIELGLINEIQLDIEGIIEYNYHITPKGIHCLSQQNVAVHK